jgi:hypothetical protein
MQSYGYKVIALRKRDGFATLFLVACLKDVGTVFFEFLAFRTRRTVSVAYQVSQIH